ncbi:MAG TPA: hypothetical protein VFU43_26045 [Streptosporangiaceae bacterium]|nr:hypothetical protein [Streptosporangiaceae bacterium]
MPSRPGRGPGGDAADEQERTAAELSDRAAESVDRRYDATKEIDHDERARAGARRSGDAEGTETETTGGGPETDRSDDDPHKSA